MAENPSRPDRDDENPEDPISRMFSQFFGGQSPAGGMPDAAAMSQMFSQMQSFFGAMAQGGSGPVNWALAKDAARQGTKDSRPVDAEAKRRVAEAARLAEMWLDAVTDFTSPSATARAMSRAEWVDASLPGWQELTEPVAENASRAVNESMNSQLPEEAKGLLSGAGGMLSSLGGALFGAQLGQAVASLSSDVLGSTDAGLPLAGESFALLPQNIETFGEGLDLPQQEILLYLSLREAAHQRLFHAAPWLRTHVLELVRDFASGISIDTAGIQERLQGMDGMDPSALQELMGSGMLQPTTTPAQKAALDRLETLLALIEGWVDAVVTAASATLPSAPALREMLRRRRATGGPAEQAFAGLVGLELRPRRAREAAALWEDIADRWSREQRDELWLERELLPSASDLDDHEAFFSARALIEASDDDFDAAMAAWLDGPKAEAADEDAEESPAEGADDSDGEDGQRDEGPRAS